MNQKAKKVQEKLDIKKTSIDFNFWANKTLDQDPESTKRKKKGSRIQNPDPH